jgi:hypothetical protein
MAILANGPRVDPAWLPAARQICRGSGITIAGWGPNLLTLEAPTPESRTRVTALLAAIGLRPISNPDDEYAGLLDFSADPAALEAQIDAHLAAVEISRRPLQERMVPIIWMLGSLLLLRGILHWRDGSDAYVNIFLGVLSLAIFGWDAPRVWGWQLQITPQCLRVRRNFHWTEFRWDSLRTAYITEDSRDGRSNVVALDLIGRSAEQLGSFDNVFAHELRDRLLQEIDRHKAPAQLRAQESASLVNVH